MTNIFFEWGDDIGIALLTDFFQRPDGVISFFEKFG